MDCIGSVAACLRATTLVLLFMAPGTTAIGRAAGSEPEVAAEPVTADNYPERRVKFSGDVIGLPDLTYSMRPGFRPLTLDLYLPPESMPKPEAGFPLVVHIHGGGWMTGHARQEGAFADFPAVLASLAAEGYVVASVNYRLSSEAPSPAAGIDVKTAIRWLRAKADDYRIDPSRAVAWGGSAGGQLAGLIAVSCGVEAFDPDIPPAGAVDPEGRPLTASLPPDVARQSDCVQGTVAWYGVFDFTTILEQAGYQRNHPSIVAGTAYLGCDPAHCPPGLVAGASSTTYVDETDPPMLLIHGTADETVPYRQSEEMAAKLTAAGVPVELILIPDVDHSFIGKSPADTRAATLKALQATFDFIDESIGAGR